VPHFDIVKEHTADKTFRVASVLGRFDLQSEKIKEHFAGDLSIESNDWSVGVIYGASGTGKSTIARELFPNDYIQAFPYEKRAVIDEMPSECSFESITATFNAVGFATVWSWLKPFSVLSTGEQMRVNIARAILENRNLIVFDEFTSVVNREVARVSSFAISKAIRRAKKQFIAVTCHDDILDWLEPDWTFCTDDMIFVKKNDCVHKSNWTSIELTNHGGVFLDAITI